MMTPEERATDVMALDDDWLEATAEGPIDADLEIIDPHHHLFSAKPFAYHADDLLREIIGSGHNVRGTVYVEAEREMYRRSGRDELRSVGETEFANRAAVVGAASPAGPQICQRIISHVDLVKPGVSDALAAHVASAGGRLAGIRVHAYRDEAGLMSHKPPEHAVLRREFQQGFKILQSFGLVCDIVVFHPQLPDVARLAEVFPDVKIIVNHAGGPLGIGRYAGRWESVRSQWMSGLEELVPHPNVYLKLGGLANRYTTGISFRAQAAAPSSDQLADTFAPYVLPALHMIGPKRCMFESDFPMEKLTCSYTNLWNAFKKLAEDLPPADRDAVFARTAAEAYGVRNITR